MTWLKRQRAFARFHFIKRPHSGAEWRRGEKVCAEKWLWIESRSFYDTGRSKVLRACNERTKKEKRSYLLLQRRNKRNRETTEKAGWLAFIRDGPASWPTQTQGWWSRPAGCHCCWCWCWPSASGRLVNTRTNRECCCVVGDKNGAQQSIDPMRLVGWPGVASLVVG